MGAVQKAVLPVFSWVPVWRLGFALHLQSKIWVGLVGAAIAALHLVPLSCRAVWGVPAPKTLASPSKGFTGFHLHKILV